MPKTKRIESRQSKMDGMSKKHRFIVISHLQDWIGFPHRSLNTEINNTEINEFSILGCFEQSGLQRKKNPNCQELSFLCFHGQKN